MPKRVDANQKEVVEGLRDVGATVAHIHMVGKGMPDLICGFRKTNYLIEIKDGNKPPSKRKLTPDEKEWHEKWKGQVSIAYSLDDALRIIGAIPPHGREQ